MGDTTVHEAEWELARFALFTKETLLYCNKIKVFCIYMIMFSLIFFINLLNNYWIVSFRFWCDRETPSPINVTFQEFISLCLRIGRYQEYILYILMLNNLMIVITFYKQDYFKWAREYTCENKSSDKIVGTS